MIPPLKSSHAVSNPTCSSKRPQREHKQQECLKTFPGPKKRPFRGHNYAQPRTDHADRVA